MLDSEGKVNGVNPAGESLLGCRSVAMAGRPIGSFLAEGCEALAEMRGMIGTGAEVKGKRVRVRPVSGREINAEITAVPYRDSEGAEWWITLKPL